MSAKRAAPDTVTLPAALLNDIAIYLMSRPYREVVGLLTGLQRSVVPTAGRVGPPATQAPRHAE